MHNLLTQDQITRLRENAASEDDDFDPIPVAKLHVPEADYTMLLTELDFDEPHIATGLCDYGTGRLSYTQFDLNELYEMEDATVQSDASFSAQHHIGIYIHAANTHGRIVEDADLLERAEYELRQAEIIQAQKAFAHYSGGICHRPPPGFDLIAGTTASDLLTKKQIHKLLENGGPSQRGRDHAPVAKLLIPHYRCAWLLTELDPQNPSLAYGLCDKGDGWPRIGQVSLSYIAEFSEGLMWPLERDKSFRARHPISVYAQAAHRNKRVTEDHTLLRQACIELGRKDEEQSVTEPLATEPPKNLVPT